MLKLPLRTLTLKGLSERIGTVGGPAVEVPTLPFGLFQLSERNDSDRQRPGGAGSEPPVRAREGRNCRLPGGGGSKPPVRAVQVRHKRDVR